MSMPLLQASRSLFKQPAFLIAFAVLLTAAISINAATQALKLHFKKEAVALAHPLDDVNLNLPLQKPVWQCVSKDVLSEDVEQELETHQYIMRFYIRRSALQPDELANFETLDNHKRIDYLNQLRTRYKGQLDHNVVSFAVTYYTGKADTVPHIPERCYVAGGFTPTDAQSVTWNVITPQIADGKLPVRYVSFVDSNTQGTGAQAQLSKNVAYFFHANGQYTSEPGEVRLKLQNLFAKYGYFAKVELMVEDQNRQAAAETMTEFLRSALPEVERCLPDWAAVERLAKGNRG